MGGTGQELWIEERNEKWKDMTESYLKNYIMLTKILALIYVKITWVDFGLKQDVIDPLFLFFSAKHNHNP